MRRVDPMRATGGAVLALAMVSMAGGCAEKAFSAHSRDNSAEDVRRALTLSKTPAKGPQNGSGHGMAFIVTSGNGPDKQLVGVDLTSGSVAWKVAADVRSRVAVGKGLVAHRQGERDIVGRDPMSGQERFTVHLGGDERFMGLAVDEARLYYVIQSTSAGRRVSYTVGIDRSGHEAWRTPAQGTLGAPAARGGLVVVPFANQNVSLLDGNTGNEIGRVRNTDDQISFVRGLSEGIFYGGSKGVYLLDQKSIAGNRAGSSYVEAKLASEQMRPFYAWDAYQPAQSDYSAFDRNRLLWRATPANGGVAFEENTAVLHSFRYLFGFNTKTGKIRWAYAHPRTDVVSSEDAGTAILFVSMDGDIGALDETTGTPRVIAKTGLRVAGATIDADGYAVTPGDPAEAANALRGALEQIVWDPDARFTAVKVFATGALADVPGTETTAALIKIVRADRGLPRAAQKRAGEALIARKDMGAAKLLVDALAVHADFLADRRAVGVDVLSRAAAEIGCKEAAPLIGAQLADPETPQASLKEIVTALATLGGKDASRALRSFLLTYRADPMFLQDPSALTTAGTALVGMGSDERRFVAFVAGERRTLTPVIEALNHVLNDKGKPAVAASKPAKLPPRDTTLGPPPANDKPMDSQPPEGK